LPEAHYAASPPGAFPDKEIVATTDNQILALPLGPFSDHRNAIFTNNLQAALAVEHDDVPVLFPKKIGLIPYIPDIRL
jgi:hypothetical protein